LQLNYDGAGRKQAIKAFFLILLCGMLAEFTARGPLRAITLSSDFALPYVAARAWRTGANPYDHNALDRIWQEAGGKPERKPLRTTTPSIYPPTTLILLAPLTYLPWPAACYLMLIINVSLIILVLRLLLHLAQFADGWKSTFFLAIAFGLAPLHTGIALGNLIVASAALAFLSLWAASTKKDSLSGIFLALALCLKPQVGGIIWLGYALQRRWRISAIAIGISLMLAFFAIGRLGVRQADWMNHWKSNYLESVSESGTNSPTASNGSRHHLLNIQWLLHTFLERRWLVNLLTFTFIGIQFAILCVIIKKRGLNENYILFLSALIALGLLSSYHRFYDAMLLILPLLWSLTAISGMYRKEARLCLLLILPFLVPGAVILKEAIVAGYLPRNWESSWWWNSIALPHQVWLLAGLSVCLTYALARESPVPGVRCLESRTNTTLAPDSGLQTPDSSRL
jgi:glycosyl transferase family 87